MIKYFILFCLVFPGFFAHSAESRFYIGGSLRAALPLKYHRLGWTGDDVCYPGFASCGGHVGYGWLERVNPEWISNPGLGVYLGWKLDKNIRIDISLDNFYSFQEGFSEVLELYYLKENKNPFPKYTSFFDGLILPKVEDISGSLTKVNFIESDGAISTKSALSDLHVISLLANIYLDIPIAGTLFTPYIGLGGGFSLVRANLYFQSEYKDTSLNSLQDVGFSGVSLTARVKLGLNYMYSDNISYSLGLSYTTMLSPVTDRTDYKVHPNQDIQYNYSERYSLFGP